MKLFSTFEYKQYVAMKKEFRLRCWIAVDGEKFFGPGPAELLQQIEESGSIAKAAKAMKMSYKKAWDIIDLLNSSGQKPYVVSFKGGEKGGGAELTATGKKVVTRYNSLIKKLNSVIEKDKDILNLI